jgi:flagellum-specific ATP synthase
MSDPIADQSRSILDGHIVLSRSLTDMGIYPPIDILNSASRVMGDVITKEHGISVREFRKLYSLLKDNEVLIRIGAYNKGADHLLDRAIEKKSFMDTFMSQNPDEVVKFKETIDILTLNM